jgi:replicative DNA helicase
MSPEIPPHSLEAERSVLGAILIRPDVLHDVADQVRPEDFFRDAHRRIFRHMLVLSARKVEIDGLTVKESLAASNELEEVGGPAYLYGLSDGVPHSVNAPVYARIVQSHAGRRWCI